jgi:transposase
MLTQPAGAFIFLDETGVATDLVRRYARGPRGARVIDHAPWGHWEMHTIIAGLRLQGVVASAVLEGAMDADSFVAYVHQILVPTLHRGDTVILDNLLVHKDRRAAEAIIHAGATLRFLPPYSPDLNPIEPAFAKLKGFLRATRPRSFDAVCTRVGEALTLYSPAECAAYIRHCGYSVL